MIHILDNPLGAAGEEPLLQSMLADRKRLFIDLFGWKLPVIDGLYEIDQYDRAPVTYIVIADDKGRHEASIRLMPTTSPHMLGDIFPHLCPHGVPAGPHICESSRLCLPQRHGAQRRRQLRNILISRMVDLAVDRGITCLTGILPEAFRKEVLAMGWAAEPLGPVIRDESGSIGAFAAHIAADTPARLGWTGVYTIDAGQVPA
ncbi:MAG TPA: acyl-homoserine-lactone synthase [Sphingobium sp.]|uniref:acyl-homoserine-lactone synthase n=1 Tax=Sphingobium sp. TaxID=1912891 RepID=UPI002ED10B7E